MRSRLSVPFSSGHRLLRGSGLLIFCAKAIFQSPFHRGIGCYTTAAGREASAAMPLSVPFSSGHRLLLIDRGEHIDVFYVATFSPLFIGA